jgi:uncharacterized Zn finger protein
LTVELTEEIVRSLSTAKSFERGREYYQSGAVNSVSRRGDVLTGDCEGSSDFSYHLRVEMDANGILAASCSCPYQFEGICKHLVALLLRYIYKPEEFIQQEGITEMLSGLDRDELVRLFDKLTERDPDLYDWLEMTIPAVKVSTKKGSTLSEEKRKSHISTQVYRRQVSNILHSLDGYRMSEAYWMMGGMVKQLGQIVDSASAFLEAGDAEGASSILMTILEEVTGSYAQFDDSDGELGGFLDQLGQPLAEAILTADLSEKDRKKLEVDLQPIVNELSDYGIEGLEVALAALRHGWVELGDDEGSEEELDSGNEYEWYGEVDLTSVKLNILDRQGRLEEYLALCQKAGEYGRYTLKLVEFGRIDEGMVVAMNNLTSVQDALMVAQALQNTDHLQEAIVLGEHGLALEGNKHSLGSWLGPLEEAQGRPEQALQAYRAAFVGLPSLEQYSTLKRLAGSRWRELQPILINTLHAASNKSVLIDVYLAEEEWDSAITLIDQDPWDYTNLEKVADVVIGYRPDWVIRVSCKQAEGLIEKKQSKYYTIAVHWLAKAKKAFIQSGEKPEWEAYLSNLKSTYARRPALQAELRRL